MKRKIPMVRITVLLLGLFVSISCMGTWKSELCGEKVAIISFHEEDDWALRQEEELGLCGWFTQRRLEDGNITLETCHGRYVTAPRQGTTRSDWMLRQERRPGDCGRFMVRGLGSGEVVLETCAGRLVTAGDGNWPGDLAWTLVAETEELLDWERFTLMQP
jgi:hypothetical protein